MIARETPYGCAATLLVLSVTTCVSAPYLWDLGFGGASMYAGIGAAMLAFGAIAVVTTRLREVREAGYASELHDAARLDELVLHRVSIAIPVRAAEELAGDIEPGKAHRLFERLERHLGSGVRLAHVAETVDRASDPAAILDDAARALENRTRDEASGTYREQARSSVADGGEDGLVVASVLVVAHPTGTMIGAVRTIAEARKLSDAILPIAPERTRAARVVITPASGRTLDATSLAVAFPELAPLSIAPHPLR